jgi:hypothetical protein
MTRAELVLHWMANTEIGFSKTAFLPIIHLPHVDFLMAIWPTLHPCNP